MAIVQTTQDGPPLGDLGKFRFKLKKFLNPIKLVSAVTKLGGSGILGKGGGLLSSVTPWGWAAIGTTVAAGGATALIAQHRKKRKRRKAMARQAAAQGAALTPESAPAIGPDGQVMAAQPAALVTPGDAVPVPAPSGGPIFQPTVDTGAEADDAGGEGAVAVAPGSPQPQPLPVSAMIQQHQARRLLVLPDDTANGSGFDPATPAGRDDADGSPSGPAFGPHHTADAVDPASATDDGASDPGAAPPGDLLS